MASASASGSSESSECSEVRKVTATRGIEGPDGATTWVMERKQWYAAEKDAWISAPRKTFPTYTYKGHDEIVIFLQENPWNEQNVALLDLAFKGANGCDWHKACTVAATLVDAGAIKWLDAKHTQNHSYDHAAGVRSAPSPGFHHMGNLRDDILRIAASHGSVAVLQWMQDTGGMERHAWEQAMAEATLLTYRFMLAAGLVPTPLVLSWAIKNKNDLVAEEITQHTSMGAVEEEVDYEDKDTDEMGEMDSMCLKQDLESKGIIHTVGCKPTIHVALVALWNGNRMLLNTIVGEEGSPGQVCTHIELLEADYWLGRTARSERYNRGRVWLKNKLWAQKLTKKCMI